MVEDPFSFQLRKLTDYLQREEVRERIQKTLQRSRTDITVTISQAAKLLNISENQLRDWEKRGLIRPIRTPGGHRTYTPQELDRLTIIRELLDAGFTPYEMTHPSETIRSYLQNEEVRERILSILQRIRSGIAVPISQA